MNGFLTSDNIELARVDPFPVRGEPVEPRLIPPSTDAERSAFVKQLARAALDLGVRADTRVGPPPTKLMFPNGVKGAPASLSEPKTPARVAKAERYYRIDVWFCGETAHFCAQSALLPRELRDHFVRDGITLEEKDGSLEWFDPASISRLRIDVLMQSPGAAQLRNIVLKTRGAK